MSTSLTLTSTAEGWHLQTPADMQQCLAELMPSGYVGGVVMTSDGASAVWTLEINCPGVTAALVAVVGSWVVRWNGEVMVFTSDQFAAAGFGEA